MWYNDSMDKLLEELFNWGTLFGFVFAVILLWLGSLFRSSERKEERKASAKINAKSQITTWAEDCLKNFNEIRIKIYGTDFPTLKSLDIYSDLQRLEAPGKSAYSCSNILGKDVRQKTKVALDNLHKAIVAFKNRDETVWSIMPTVESSFSELVEHLSKKEF